MKKRTIILAAAALFLSCIASAQSQSFKLGKWTEIQNAILKELNRSYVDSLPVDRIERAGIDAMLGDLDPYTVYIPEEENEDLQMMVSKSYGGIGAVIYKPDKDGNVIINEPYAGSPAVRYGLRCGDEIMEIDGVSTHGLTSQECSDRMKGKPGTVVKFKVKKVYTGEIVDIDVTRERIHLPDVEYAGMLDAETGYIYQSGFTENVSNDIRNAVLKLKKQGMKKLVLDLRGNGGGLLAEAVKIVNLFVPKGKTIVETKGKTRLSSSSYSTTREPLDLNIPLCVLVNHRTASASEILAGSLQDLDRAVIVGARTYGKGLVQSPRDLPFSSNIKLTTAKYYIVSGRCIQAIDYKKKREKGGDGRTPDSLATVFHTAAGRVVLDGNGIKPDIEVKHDTMANIVYYISNDDVLTDWGSTYYANHPTIPDVDEFEITDDDFEALKALAQERKFKYDRLSLKQLEELKKTAKFEGYYEEAQPEFEALEKKLEHNLSKEMDRYKKEIKQMMAVELMRRYYYQSGTIREAIIDDDDVKKASEILSDSKAYRKILSPAPPASPAPPVPQTKN